MIFRTFFIIIIAVIGVISARPWFSCNRFADNFYFSALDLKLRLIEAVHNDKDTSINLVRFFHNKGSGAVFDLFKHYMQFFDIQFLINFLSFAGIFGLIYGLWFYLNKNNKNKILKYGILILFIFPFIEISINPPIAFNIKLLTLLIPYQLTVLLGFWNFLKKDINIFKLAFILFLVVISIWWIMIFPNNVFDYCLK